MFTHLLKVFQVFSDQIPDFLKLFQRSLYKTKRRGGVPVLTRNWLVSPGWSTSWMAQAKTVASTSRSVNTFSSAGTDSSTCDDCVTSAACMLLWYGTSRLKCRFCYGVGNFFLNVLYSQVLPLLHIDLVWYIMSEIVRDFVLEFYFFYRFFKCQMLLLLDIVSVC